MKGYADATLMSWASKNQLCLSKGNGKCRERETERSTERQRETERDRERTPAVAKKV